MSLNAHQMRQAAHPAGDQHEAHRHALLAALGMDPLRDWDDIVNAAKCLVKERDELREHKRTFQNIVIFTSEHVAAICAELDLSYEAETETVVAAIRRLKAGPTREA